MKKIFKLVGLVLALHCLYTMLIVADSLALPIHERSFDLELDREVSAEEIYGFAEDLHAAIQIRQYNSTTGMNNLDVKIMYANREGLRWGRQDSIFPGNRVIFERLDRNTGERYTGFCVISDRLTVEELSSYFGISPGNIIAREGVTINLFAFLRVIDYRMFLYTLVLIALCIFSMLLTALKEISILRLYGTDRIRSVFMVYRNLMAGLLGVFLVPCAAAMIYTGVTDPGMLRHFGRLILIYVAAVLCIYAAAFPVVFLAAGKISSVRAIKGDHKAAGRYVFFFSFKAVLFALLVASLNDSFRDTSNMFETVSAFERLKHNNLFYVITSNTPEEKTILEIDRQIGEIPDGEVYQYDVLFEDNTVRMSASVLNLIELYDPQGIRITPEMLREGEETLLIPEHLKGQEKKITQDDPDTEVHYLYIKDGQITDYLFAAGAYIYDAVYYVFPLEKKLYSQPMLYMSAGAAGKIRRFLEENHFPKADIRVKSLNDDYRTDLENARAKLIHSAFYFAINLISLLLSIRVLFAIYTEMHGKELAVFRLSGRRESKVYGKFLVFNLLLSAGIVALINYELLGIVIAEGGFVPVVYVPEREKNEPDGEFESVTRKKEEFHISMTE